MDVVTQSLDLMWKGMLSIFIVIGVIFLITLVITKIKPKAKNTPDGNGKNDNNIT